MATDKLKVLIADDDEMALLLLTKQLSDLYAVTTVLSGKEALDAMEKVRFDILLSDIGMPAPNGLELTRIVRSKHPATDVIILTGHAGMKVVVDALEAGAYDYLGKPFDITLVRAALRRCAEKRVLSGGAGPMLERIRAMAARVRELKEGVETAEMGAEHESCKGFARKLIAEVEQGLARVDPGSTDPEPPEKQG